MTSTEPLTPPDLDLRDFDWMPLDVARLRDSDLSVLASGDAFRAAVLLWCAAWHQVPAGSLPKEDRLLANYAGYGRDLKGWASVRTDAMHGFIECTDGRYYHPVVSAKAIEADEQRNKKRDRTAAATEARRGGKRNDKRNAKTGGNRNGDRDDNRNDGADDPRNEVHHTLPNPTLPSEAHASESGRERFDEFWNAYPRRDEDEQRDRAASDFGKLVSGGVDPAVIIFAAKAYCAKIRKQNNYATKFVKVAWRWLGEQDFTGAAPVTTANPDHFEPAERDWHSAVKRWLLNESNWPRWAGNAPGTPSCRCPPDVLAAEGVCPNTARRIDSGWYFAVDGTPEMQAHLDFAARHKLKIRLYDITVDGVERHGAWFMKRFPPGYDEATGEYRPADKEDAA